MILSCDSTIATVCLCSGRDVKHLQGQKAASWQAALPRDPVLGSLQPCPAPALACGACALCVPGPRDVRDHPALPAHLSCPPALQEGLSRPSPSLCQGTRAPWSPKPRPAPDTQRVVPAPRQPGLPAADLSSEDGKGTEFPGISSTPAVSVVSPSRVTHGLSMQEGPLMPARPRALCQGPAGVWLPHGALSPTATLCAHAVGTWPRPCTQHPPLGQKGWGDFLLGL